MHTFPTALHHLHRWWRIHLACISLVIATQINWAWHHSFDDILVRLAVGSAVGLLISMAVITAVRLLPVAEIDISLQQWGKRLWPTLLLIPAPIVDPTFPLLSALMVLLLMGADWYNQRAHTISSGRTILICKEYTSDHDTTSSPTLLWGLFAAALALIIFRDISLILSPRFWAEDAGHVFSYAYHHHWLEALLRPGEYFLLLSNLASVMATELLTLEHAPLPFTMAGMFAQAAAIWVILWGDAPLWHSIPRKLFVILVVLITPATEEIWLNANGGQYYLALTSALILLDTSAVRSRLTRLLYRILLACAGLTGLLSCLLTPMFIAKAVIEKKREHYVHALILLSATLVQVVVVAMTISETNATRFDLPPLHMVGFIVAEKNFLLPLHTGAAELFSTFMETALSVEATGAIILLGSALLALALTILATMAYLLRGQGGYYLAGTVIIMMLFVCIFGIGGENKEAFLQTYGAGRYFYVPNVLITIAIVFSCCALERLLPPRHSIAATTIIITTLYIGNGLNHFFTTPLHEPGWPVWREEVAIWRQHPRYVLRVWPSGWHVRLIPETESE
jgi:hypothetical protein